MGGGPLLQLAEMLHQAGHDFNEIAGAVAAIQLIFQDSVPGILAGTRGAGDAEDEGILNEAAAGAGLAGGGADFVERDLVEERGEAVTLFIE